MLGSVDDHPAFLFFTYFFANYHTMRDFFMLHEIMLTLFLKKKTSSYILLQRKFKARFAYKCGLRLPPSTNYYKLKVRAKVYSSSTTIRPFGLRDVKWPMPLENNKETHQ